MTKEPNSGLPIKAEDVLRFWFDELQPEQWWKCDKTVDDTVRARFSTLYTTMAANGAPAAWRDTARGRLAAVIVLDQFPRNLFRNSPKAFATDASALALAVESVDAGLDETLSIEERGFLYMPFQHSEDAEQQARSVVLFASLGNEHSLQFAQQHKLVIDRFGRFPHRNKVLGRETTEEEKTFLEKESWFW